ncbi:hypothetical protein IWW51_002764 [Coemansia sp. RSA 2702]|nr:hypothetical protein IWW51_002764 [Coemansia sp. RSA 2702]
MVSTANYSSNEDTLTETYPIDHPRTPEKLAETYRPSGSPTRVSGTKVVASVKFTEAGERGLCKSIA